MYAAVYIKDSSLPPFLTIFLTLVTVGLIILAVLHFDCCIGRLVAKRAGCGRHKQGILGSFEVAFTLTFSVYPGCSVYQEAVISTKDGQ